MSRSESLLPIRMQSDPPTAGDGQEHSGYDKPGGDRGTLFVEEKDEEIVISGEELE